MRRLVAALLLVSASALAQGQPDPNDPMYQDESRLMRLAQATHAYSYKHNGQMPPDMAAMVEVLGKDKPVSQAIRDNFIAPGISSPKVPDDAKADWVNKNSTYEYLGGEGIEVNEVPDWGEIVLAHLKLDDGHATAVSPANPEGRLFALTFMDGHGELQDKAHAQRAIDHSRQILEAVRTGAPFPDQQQATWNLQIIMKAVDAYAKDHGDQLPGDIGSLLPFVPTDKKRLATPQQCAAVFLSAAARKGTHVPDAPDADWVNHHSSYIYLGAATPDSKPLFLHKIEDPRRTLLFHGRLDAGFDVKRADGPAETVFPIVNIGHEAFVQDRGSVDAMIAESRQVLDAARTGSPLPPYQATIRDLRLINKAISAYQADHDKQYPPDLGSTLRYLPTDELPTPADRARVYLSPRAKRRIEPPEDLTPEWVNANATYAYLAAGPNDKPLTRADLKGRVDIILIHAPVQEAFDVRMFCAGGGCRMEVIPYVDLGGEVFRGPTEWLQSKIALSKEFIHAARTGTLVIENGVPMAPSERTPSPAGK
jgi:hypothetical protein